MNDTPVVADETNATNSANPVADAKNPAPFIEWSCAEHARDPNSKDLWIWDGYLAPGNITLFTSQWKSGKTTLVAHLLKHLLSGDDLLGMPVRPGRALIVSEETHSLWARRHEKLNLGDRHRWICRPFATRPDAAEWRRLVQYLADSPQRSRFDLIVIDPMAACFPSASENFAHAMLDNLLLLRELTSQGLAVLLIHHPRKGETLVGQSARGSGLLGGFVDISMEMRWYLRGDTSDRRRRLLAWSRYEETPAHLVLELSAEGSGYVCHGYAEEDELTGNWLVLQEIFAEALHKLTRLEILADWPTHLRKPNEATLWRWLDKLLNQGSVKSEGSGHRGDPFVYWIPAREEQWLKEDSYMFELLGKQMDREYPKFPPDPTYQPPDRTRKGRRR